MKQDRMEKTIALAGNPNVGKSTVFNELTGMHQHTGNWPGKTVSNASGICSFRYTDYTIYDLPGTYSLIAHSKEEEVARDFLCFEPHDAVIVVCDAVCLERNLNLVLQTLEITNQVIVCVNLLDEAKKKKIQIDLKKLSEKLGVPVVGTSARSKKGLDKLMEKVDDLVYQRMKNTPHSITYAPYLEKAITKVEDVLTELEWKGNTRWLAMQLLSQDEVIYETVQKQTENNPLLEEVLEEARLILYHNGASPTGIKDLFVSTLMKEAETICQEVVTYGNEKYLEKGLKIDKVITSRKVGIPLMVLLLIVVFWITIVGANYPSTLLSDFLFSLEKYLFQFLNLLHAPVWLSNMLVLGMYRVLAWVVAVMLPPMAIFFPLFTLLEDLGYLPRIAFNMDHAFRKCSACGKQALTMTMGFGCNAAGVTGCRIIDSPRERMLAILTNNFVPCNGRFPILISVITMFFIGFQSSIGAPFLSVLLLTLVILLGVGMTFLVSKLLSKTILRGVPSSFTLELPPYRKPQIGKVIVRSIFDRTLFVLGRAISIAAPAGIIIWILANVHVDQTSLFAMCSQFLDPFATTIGLDGVILMAFILGFPANEIVIPLIMMGYMASGTITEYTSLLSLKTLLVENGWTWLTAICVMIFSLMHWPCSTTCLTIKKETGSWKWVGLSILIPTIIGFTICFLLTTFTRYFGII